MSRSGQSFRFLETLGVVTLARPTLSIVPRSEREPPRVPQSQKPLMESHLTDRYHPRPVIIPRVSRNKLGRHESEEARPDVFLTEAQSLSCLRAGFLLGGWDSPAMCRGSSGRKATQKSQGEGDGKSDHDGGDSVRLA